MNDTISICSTRLGPPHSAGLSYAQLLLLRRAHPIGPSEIAMLASNCR